MATKIDLDDPLVHDFITTKTSEDAYLIMKSLNKGLTDEQIAKKTKLKVNEIRAALNVLHYHGIIIYSKKKAETSNWYTYTWFRKEDRIKELLKDKYYEEMERLNKELESMSNYQFYKCGKGCNRLPFEIAIEYDFKCPECGKAMNNFDTNKEKKKIEKRITQIKGIVNGDH